MTPAAQQITQALRQSGALGLSELVSRTRLDAAVIKTTIKTELRGDLTQDRDYRWSLAKENKLPQASPTPETPLAKLCGYYLECLGFDATGISVPQWKGGTDYMVISSIPSHKSKGEIEDLKTDAAQQLFKIQEECRFEYTLKIGFPCHVGKIPGKNFGFIEPLLTWELAKSPITGKLLPLIAGEPPMLNVTALKQLSGAGPGEVIEEAVWLSNELGLDGLTIREPLEIVERLARLRPDWVWQESPDAQPGDSPAMARIEERGIYNRVILVKAKKGGYAEGLEQELRSLQQKPETDYARTALGEESRFSGCIRSDIPPGF